METWESLSVQVGEALARSDHIIACAESCTGGWLSMAITGIPGSSAWFDRSFITYSNAAKHDLLGVSLATLEREGAVSEAVAKEMARGALQKSIASIGVSITGIAGPDGGTPAKPVGTVWIGLANTREVTATRYQFEGDRRAVREQAVEAALHNLQELAET